MVSVGVGGRVDVGGEGGVVWCSVYVATGILLTRGTSCFVPLTAASPAPVQKYGMPGKAKRAPQGPALGGGGEGCGGA